MYISSLFNFPFWDGGGAGVGGRVRNIVYMFVEIVEGGWEIIILGYAI